MTFLGIWLALSIWAIQWCNPMMQCNPIATHALAFLVRGLCTDLKHIIAYFFTGNVTLFHIMPLFWRTVAVLEVSLNLHVCAAVNDGASPNRKFFRLHSKLAREVDCDVVYKTPNIFAPSWFIFFFADSPHLMKTSHEDSNCLYNFGSGSRSRLMWNDGQYLVFQHIADLFYSDQEFALHTLPKLTLDHIVLTSFSKMKVKLAVQVLSRPLLWEKVVKRMSLVQPSSVKWWMDSLTVPMWGHWPSTSEKRIHSSCHMNLQKMSTWHSKMKDVFLKYLETWKAGNRAH